MAYFKRGIRVFRDVLYTSMSIIKLAQSVSYLSSELLYLARYMNSVFLQDVAALETLILILNCKM